MCFDFGYWASLNDSKTPISDETNKIILNNLLYSSGIIVASIPFFSINL